MNIRPTSLKTYHEIKEEGLLPRRRFEVYSYVFLNGPCTAGQIEQGLFNKSAHKRTSELRRQGMLQELGEISCPITGRSAILWEVVDALPRTLPPFDVRATRNQLLDKISDLEEYIAELEAKLRWMKT